MDTDIEEFMRDAYIGDIEGIKKGIIDNNIDVNKVTTEFGNSALLLAISAENEEMVELLLKLGASPDFANPKTGETPLICAVERNNGPITGMLLAAGCHLDAANFQFQRAIDVATPERKKQIGREKIRRQKQREERAMVMKMVSAVCYLGMLLNRFRKKQQLVQPAKRPQARYGVPLERA